MMKTAPLATIALLCALLSACDSDEDQNPAPQRVYLIDKVSHGSSLYKLFHYDQDNRLVGVENGLVDEVGDSVSTLYQVIYAADRIVRIQSADNTHYYTYMYEGQNIIESNEYSNAQLIVVNKFYYDGEKLGVWHTKHPVNGELISVQRMMYDYDVKGNVVLMEYEVYDEITRGHTLVSGTKYLDFDDQLNPASLSLNFSHPYHRQFVNNARTWRVENTNGSVGETRYSYDYNAEGYATHQRDDSGRVQARYQFVLR